jgi:hypothetical protein
MQTHFLRMTLLGDLLVVLACTNASALPLPDDPAPAVAAAPAATKAAPAMRADSAAPPDRLPERVAGWGDPLKQDRLAQSRGGTDTATATAQLRATVANNNAINVTSGNNVIDGGSFANMSGLPMVIQNTGANVLIQNATVINLQLH